jgi:hypothetical protein
LFLKAFESFKKRKTEQMKNCSARETLFGGVKWTFCVPFLSLFEISATSFLCYKQCYVFEAFLSFRLYFASNSFFYIRIVDAAMDLVCRKSQVKWQALFYIA